MRLISTLYRFKKVLRLQ